MSQKETLKQEALNFHSFGKKGKLSISLSKKLDTKKDLSLAYSPGVGYPCLEIQKDKNLAYEYTSKGNFVAVISNGTAVLGLGNLGSMASKPVMEGKSALFKKFADIDSIDVEVDSVDSEDIIKTIKNIGETWGGINLEDIAAPACFTIETKLKEMLDIPVFHDDQHGTAIVSLAGLINSCEITDRNIKDIKIVVNGAGAAGLSCINLMKLYGVKNENIIACDTKGVIHKERTDLNEWKAKIASDTTKRTLTEALDGADVFFGLSVKDALTKEMIIKMAPRPIIFALANPDPEIIPEDAKSARPDCIIATGRSDYVNQINNVICFPYIFRGAIDVKSSKITDRMKLAAAIAIANLTKEYIPNYIKEIYPEQKIIFGSEYIIPKPFDKRLIGIVSCAVAKAAIDEGIAKQKILDFDQYSDDLLGRVDTKTRLINKFFSKNRVKDKVIAIENGSHDNAILIAKILAEKYGCYVKLFCDTNPDLVFNKLNNTAHISIVYNNNYYRTAPQTFPVEIAHCTISNKKNANKDFIKIIMYKDKWFFATHKQSNTDIMKDFFYRLNDMHPNIGCFFNKETFNHGDVNYDITLSDLFEKDINIAIFKNEDEMNLFISTLSICKESFAIIDFDKKCDYEQDIDSLIDAVKISIATAL